VPWQAPALTCVAIMRRALREDEDLPKVERTVRTADRRGSAAGVVTVTRSEVWQWSSTVGVPGLVHGISDPEQRTTNKWRCRPNVAYNEAGPSVVGGARH
jgi:hypothetical protein